MSEFSFSRTTNKNELSSYLFYHLFYLFSSIFSDPLYFSYFILFSPFLFRLFSFLSPLLITTTLLLAALLTVNSTDPVVENAKSEFFKSKFGFLLSVYQICIERLRPKTHDKDEKFGFLNELEAYMVMFQQSIFDVLEPKSEGDYSEGLEAAPDALCEEREDFGPVEEPLVNSDRIPTEKVDIVEATRPIEEVKKSLESLFQETTELENMSCQKEDKEVKPLDPELDKVEESKEKLPLRSGSKVMGNRHLDAEVSSYSGGDHAAAMKVKSQMLVANTGIPESNWKCSGKALEYNQELCSSPGSFGSIRREKRWKRTLAYKLLEERNYVNGSDGMDMLWETYETSSIKIQKKINTRKQSKGLSLLEYMQEDEEEEDNIEAELCCLQALKLSSGKNFGMGRSNFLKLSNALKPIGWLHQASKHGKDKY